MDNAALEFKSRQLRNIRKALINSEIRIPRQVFLFWLFVNKEVPDKEDLNRIPLFSKLNDEEIRRCIDSSDELFLQSGEEFITEGKPADYFCVLLSGTVQVTKKVSDKNEVNVASHGAGTFLGEVPILLDIPYEVTIRTVELSRLLRLKKKSFGIF